MPLLGSEVPLENGNPGEGDKVISDVFGDWVINLNLFHVTNDAIGLAARRLEAVHVAGNQELTYPRVGEYATDQGVVSFFEDLIELYKIQNITVRAECRADEEMGIVALVIGCGDRETSISLFNGSVIQKEDRFAFNPPSMTVLQGKAILQRSLRLLKQG
jgi:hypothetical protein